MADILVPDYLLGIIGVVLVVSILLLLRIRTIIGGKYFNSIIKAAARRFRQPIQRINLFKGNYFETEIMDAEQAVVFDKESTNTPVTIDETHQYRSPGPYKTYFFSQDNTTNIDPIHRNEKLHEILKRIGLLNDKYLDYKEQRLRSKWADKILDKDHFNKVALIQIIGIGAALFLLYNLTTFANGAQELYNQWLPIIEAQFEDVPRLVAESGISIDSITKGITGG